MTYQHQCPACGSMETALCSQTFTSTCQSCGEVERLDAFRRCVCGGKMVTHTTNRHADRKLASMRCQDCGRKILVYSQVVEEVDDGRFPRGRGVVAQSQQMDQWEVQR